MDPNQTQNQNLNNPNTPTSSVPPVPPAPPPPAPPPVAPSQPSPTQEAKSNGKVVLFIVAGILLLIVLGAIYFMAQQFRSSSQQKPTPTPTQVPTPTSTPTPTPLSEKDIDTIDLGNLDADLKNIEDDVKQL